ncbi:reverse transcriptase domain-containing protein [Tanacetum coccineum]
MDSGSSCKVIYEHYFLKLKPSIRSLRVDSKTPLVSFSGEYSWPLGEVPLEITIGDGLLIVTKTLNFVIVRSDLPHDMLLGRTAMKQMGIVQRIESEARQADKEDILICVDAKEKLVAHTDVFAWTTAHMTGVPRTIMVGGEIFNTEHRVNESKHVEPVKQKKGSMSPERNEAIHTKVEELTKTNVLREVKYQTWVSNPVIAKKADGRWKLWIDFTDINKACPKENHPLPATESKVEDIHQHRFKCFLDTYKGYHQIPIAKKDKEKTAFYTREGVFCYKRLPFGLKNARATYQRLIDKVFSCQVGRNMEVNVDEMVIKSDFKEEMLADIKETLERLRVINLKLNPKKCSFGVEEGRFSGHIITKQGIKADPSKVKAISDLQPPKSVSEIQSLGKKLAAINRYLSKGVDKTFPFMRTLKNYTSRKMVQWTTEANKAFRRMKALLEALPIVTAPVNGENLDSPNITWGRARIPRTKKAHTAPRICCKKDVKIFSSSPHPELGEHEIEFRGRNSIKGHILADFLAKTPSKKDREIKDGEAKRKEPEPENAWKLFTDITSSSDGSGAGLTLINPEGKEYTYALRFPTGSKSSQRTLRSKATCHKAIHGKSEGVAIKTTTNGTRRHKLPSSGHRLLYKMGQSKAANINDQEAHGKIRVGIHSVQVEVTNREVVKGMERSLVYGSEVVIPIEISVETRRIQDFDPKKNVKRRREDLDILEEIRVIASIKEAHYKQKLEKYYNKRVRPSIFKPGTYVLRLNSASKAEFQGKMGPT